MYIIKILGNIEIQADADEIQKVIGSTEGMIVLRNGVVNIKHISAIVRDTEREKLVLKRPGDTEESVRLRIENERSEDIFPQLRRQDPTLFTLDKPFIREPKQI